MGIFKKRKRRLREVCIDDIEKIRLAFNFSKKDIADILCVSSGQVSNYYRSRAIGMDKYLTLINALRASVEREANQKRKFLDELLGITMDDEDMMMESSKSKARNN